MTEAEFNARAGEDVARENEREAETFNPKVAAFLRAPDGNGSERRAVTLAAHCHARLGEPIIGGIPNMRTLNVVKKGLDAIVDDNRNEFGRLAN